MNPKFLSLSLVCFSMGLAGCGAISSLKIGLGRNNGASADHSDSALVPSFSPQSGPVGTLVSTTHATYSSLQSMEIGGLPLLFLPSSDGVGRGLVLPGISSGIVKVVTGQGEVSFSDPFILTASEFPSVQQGSKLVGSGYVGAANQGSSVAISADGNTAIVGALSDDGLKGAAWVFTRSGGVWTQQGTKLVGSGATNPAQQGVSVALSADGNTAAIGGTSDDNSNNSGAVWVFTRSGGVWTQQGSKLVGSGGVTPTQGSALALSADGNTLLVGGQFDNNQGAVWIFTRSSGVWSQQGPKLVGSGLIGSNTRFGNTVSLSADGNTALVGAFNDDTNTGASWVFTRSAGVWTQQGGKLIGSGAIGSSAQGVAVALSGDGNTAFSCGSRDNISTGACWVFTRSGTNWTEQAKLVGTVASTFSNQGSSVSTNMDGNIVLFGAPLSSPAGAFWVFTRSGGVWTQQGPKLVGSGTSGASTIGNSLSLSSDGKTAIVAGYADASSTGAVWIWTP